MGDIFIEPKDIRMGDIFIEPKDIRMGDLYIKALKELKVIHPWRVGSQSCNNTLTYCYTS